MNTRKLKAMSLFWSYFSVPKPSLSFRHIFFRNLSAQGHYPLVNFLWALGEPLLYLLVFGLGLGHFVGEINSVSYSEFVVPGLVAASSMLIAYFESSYGAFERFKRQKLHRLYLSAPICRSDILMGEFLFAVFKALVACVILYFVAWALGMVSKIPEPLALLPLFFSACVFSAFGLLVGFSATRPGTMICVQTLVLLPMFLMSGTLYPLTVYPEAAQSIVLATPLGQTVVTFRYFLQEGANSLLSISFALQAIITLVLLSMAERRFKDI